MSNVCKEGVASVDPITVPVKRVCTIINVCCARLSAVGCSRHNVGSGLPSLKRALVTFFILAEWTNNITGLPDTVTDQASRQDPPCMFVIIFPWRWYDWGWGWGSGWGIVIVVIVYSAQYQSDWNQGIHLLMFAAREAVQESLGFSPFELVFGCTLRGPLKLLKEWWFANDPPDSLLDQVSSLRDWLVKTTKLAQQK